MELHSRAAAVTRAWGAALAPLLEIGDVIVLSGDLGAGKTVFAKGVAAGLGVTEPVVSPTFTIMREYEGRLPLFHLDVYRLDHLQEAIDLGLEEYLEHGVVVVEWGEGVREVLGPDRLEISLELLAVDEAGDDERLMRVECVGARWEARRTAVATALRAAAEAPTC